MKVKLNILAIAVLVLSLVFNSNLMAAKNEIKDITCNENRYLGIQNNMTEEQLNGYFNKSLFFSAYNEKIQITDENVFESIYYSSYLMMKLNMYIYAGFELYSNKMINKQQLFSNISKIKPQVLKIEIIVNKCISYLKKQPITENIVHKVNAYRVDLKDYDNSILINIGVADTLKEQLKALNSVYQCKNTSKLLKYIKEGTCCFINTITASGTELSKFIMLSSQNSQRVETEQVKDISLISDKVLDSFEKQILNSVTDVYCQHLYYGDKSILKYLPTIGNIPLVSLNFRLTRLALDPGFSQKFICAAKINSIDITGSSNYDIYYSTLAMNGEIVKLSMVLWSTYFSYIEKEITLKQLKEVINNTKDAAEFLTKASEKLETAFSSLSSTVQVNNSFNNSLSPFKNTKSKPDKKMIYANVLEYLQTEIDCLKGVYKAGNTDKIKNCLAGVLVSSENIKNSFSESKSFKVQKTITNKKIFDEFLKYENEAVSFFSSN